MVCSGPEFQAWLCRVHNRVNYSLNKPVFSCELAAARWQPLDCSAEGGDGRSSACDLAVGSTPSRPPASRTRGRM